MRLYAGSVDIYFDRFTDAQEKGTWIFNSPLHVRNVEVSISSPMVREYLHTNRHGEFVFCAIEVPDQNPNTDPRDLNCPNKFNSVERARPPLPKAS